MMLMKIELQSQFDHLELSRNRNKINVDILKIIKMIFKSDNISCDICIRFIFTHFL